MSGNRTYRLSPLAEADLEDIWRYTFTTWSIEQADSYIGSLMAAFEGLAANRKNGRPIDIRAGYFKYTVGSHLVYYRITDASLEVVRVLHQQMDATRHL